MTESNVHEPVSLLAGEDQPLICIPVTENGREAVRYFTDDAEAERYVTDEDIQAALNAIGAWSDLDWEEVEAELYRIGHQTPPTLPIDPSDL